MLMVNQSVNQIEKAIGHCGRQVLLFFFFTVHHLFLGEMPFPHFYVTLL